MNIVVTCCLGDYMKSNIDIIHKSIENAKVIGVDCNYMYYNFVGVDEFVKVPRTLDYDYVDTLLKVCDTYEADVLIPTSGLDIKVILPRINEFKCIVTIGDCIGTGIANNKATFVNFANENGIGIITSRVCHDKDSLLAFCEMYGVSFVKFPYGKKNMIVRNKDDIDLVDSYPCIAQRVIEGREYSCVCLCKHGNVLRTFVAENHKMSGGTAIHASIVDDPYISKTCADACKKLGLDGIAEFDLMGDEYQVGIIECNPRITATVSLFCAGGVNVIKAMINYYRTGYFGEIDGDLEQGVSILRFRQDMFFDENGRIML